MKARKSNLSISLDKEYDTISVIADKDKIIQVFTNLIINSIKYGKEGGETKIRFYEMGENILIEVADDGIGISQENLPRLFERFYRVDKSRSRDQGGTGLGLAIVKHILESHNQTINVRSTTFLSYIFLFLF
jgi:two-component system phosphate regulon sensor histidine kinase PhoR